MDQGGGRRSVVMHHTRRLSSWSMGMAGPSVEEGAESGGRTRTGRCAPAVFKSDDASNRVYSGFSECLSRQPKRFGSMVWFGLVYSELWCTLWCTLRIDALL